MSLRLETFSFLPPLTSEEVRAQIGYILDQGWLPIVEYSERPGPDETLWHWWKLPMLDSPTVGDVVAEIEACTDAHPGAYVRLVGFDPTVRQRARTALVVHRPR